MKTINMEINTKKTTKSMIVIGISTIKHQIMIDEEKIEQLLKFVSFGSNNGK